MSTYADLSDIKITCTRKSLKGCSSYSLTPHICQLALFLLLTSWSSLEKGYWIHLHRWGLSSSKRLHNRLVLMISIKGLLLYLFEYLEVPSPREDPGGSLGPIGFPVCISIDLLRHFILQGFPPGKPNPSALAGIHASSFLVLHDVASLD